MNRSALFITVLALAATSAGAQLAPKQFTVTTRVGTIQAERAASLDPAAVIGLDRHFSPEQIAVELGYAGPAYGSVTEEGLSAIRLLATTEGIVADPVYSGKGLAAVVDLARSGRHEGRPIVFWHTGGWHANFDPHYGDALR